MRSGSSEMAHSVSCRPFRSNLVTDTGSALATTIRRSIISVIERVWMPFTTVRFGSIQGREANASVNILSLSHWLKVIRINARWIATKMVDGQPLWYRADKPLIGKAMSQNGSAIASKSPISSSRKSAIPQPTSRGDGLNSGQKPLKRGTIYSHRKFTPFGVTRPDDHTSRALSLGSIISVWGVI